MDMKPHVAAITSDAEVSQAIATLILAFSTDPVARWIYDVPHQYLRHIPLLFHALGKSSFESGTGQHTSDGLGVALWLPPGVHGDDGALEAVITESISGEKLGEVSAVFERTEQYRPTDPIGTYRSSASKRCTGTKGVVRHYCSTGFVNAIGSIARHTYGRPIR
jgi:hypothetical protein